MFNNTVMDLRGARMQLIAIDFVQLFYCKYVLLFFIVCRSLDWIFHCKLILCCCSPATWPEWNWITDGWMYGCSPYLSKDKDMLTLMIKICNFNTEGWNQVDKNCHALTHIKHTLWNGLGYLNTGLTQFHPVGLFQHWLEKLRTYSMCVFLCFAY